MSTMNQRTSASSTDERTGKVMCPFCSLYAEAGEEYQSIGLNEFGEDASVGTVRSCMACARLARMQGSPVYMLARLAAQKQEVQG